MKKVFVFIALICFWVGFAQPNHVSWKTSIQSVSDNQYELIYEAQLEKGWHLYSQYLPPDGALPTVFLYREPKGNFELIGKSKEYGSIKKFDEIFGLELSFFENKARFVQKIKVVNPTLKKIKVSVEYQLCDDKSCTMDFDEFVFTIPGTNTSTVVEAPVIQEPEITPEAKVDTLSLQKLDAFKLSIKQNAFSEQVAVQLKNNTHWDLFILGFLGGLLALLTPCVFPMIPLTVSYFTKQAQNRKKGIAQAIIYGLFIIAIYLLLSVPFHFLDSLDPEILNSISTNVWLNVGFFVIFLFFAFSFFGYYEITLPNSWGNKMDSASSIGGLVGIFFMAVTLSIVSFSCTGPILGSLLAGSLTADGGAMQLTMGMAGFGTALALPFALFALFPGWLQSLPKSGGWMGTVKVVLGFLELALALKFLSNADLVSHWGFLKRELFLGIWMVLFSGLGLYFLGKLRFPHDAPIQKLSLSRKIFGLITFVFVAYLALGLTQTKYANLKLLSGFPPPMFYSYSAQKSDCPLGLNCFKDFEKGLAYAQEHQKPILLDFTGWACVNCRKMEENVWSDPEVFQVINDNYVLISLYVDDRKPLPESAQFDYQKPNGKIKKIKTVGDKWATFQTVNFNTASQPFYVLLSPDLEMLNSPKEYTDKADYLQWLQTGLVNLNR